MLSFCKPVSSKKRFIPNRVISNDFSFTLFDKADKVNKSEWQSITEQQTVFLEIDFS